MCKMENKKKHKIIRDKNFITEVGLQYEKVIKDISRPLKRKLRFIKYLIFSIVVAIFYGFSLVEYHYPR